MPFVRRFSVMTLLALMAGSLLAPMASAAAQSATPVATEEDAVRMMSWNIRHARGNDDCVDPTAVEGELPPTECAVNLERVAEVITDSGATVVGLQEVDRFWARSGGVDQPAALAELTGMEVCYGANLDHPSDDHGDQPHQYGVAILSAYPITDCTNTLLPTPEGWEQRGALAATLNIDGQAVTVINTHLQAGREDAEDEAVRQRTEQFASVLEIAAGLDTTVAILGDLNAEPDDAELAPIVAQDSGYTDVWTAINGDAPGYTIPSLPDEEATARIDYIFVDGAFTVLTAQVLDTDATRIAADHFPVVTDVTVSPPGATPVPPQATPVG